MKSHYCPEEKGEVQYDGQCNWCGEKEMNVYEMADELRAVLFSLGKERPFYNHADTLEQQASELDKIIPQLVKANGIIENLRIRIAELEKQIKELENQGDPVAWIPRGMTLAKPKDLTNCIPLYTTPQKYCPSDNNKAYEKGFIDGMAKQRDSSVDKWVRGEK
jgi:hypothetical protein